MLTSFPTYSLYQLSYTCNFLNCITLPFRILFSQFIYCYSIAYSVRRVGFHSYNLLSALLPTSIRIFLNAGSFFANLPAVSGVSLTLARKILYRVMASVESDLFAPRQGEGGVHRRSVFERKDVFVAASCVAMPCPRNGAEGH